MNKIPTSEIKKLRDITGAGFLDCKEALEKSDFNIENENIAVLSGPNHAEEIILGKASAAVVASPLTATSAAAAITSSKVISSSCIFSFGSIYIFIGFKLQIY